MINFKRLDNLKLMLSSEKNLAKIWSYFMTNFADHSAFTDVGEPIDNPLLEKIIVLVNQQLFNKKPESVLLIHLSNYNFIHGVFTVGNRIGGIIYFEDTQKGMIAVSENPPSKEVKYSRFTSEAIGNSSKDLN